VSLVAYIVPTHTPCAGAPTLLGDAVLTQTHRRDFLSFARVLTYTSPWPTRRTQLSAAPPLPSTTPSRLTTNSLIKHLRVDEVQGPFPHRSQHRQHNSQKNQIQNKRNDFLIQDTVSKIACTWPRASCASLFRLDPLHRRRDIRPSPDSSHRNLHR
jgi:hypothetical protein